MLTWLPTCRSEDHAANLNSLRAAVAAANHTRGQSQTLRDALRKTTLSLTYALTDVKRAAQKLDQVAEQDLAEAKTAFDKQQKLLRR